MTEETVVIRIRKESRSNLKGIAKERGMTMLGLIAYCIKCLREGKI